MTEDSELESSNINIWAESLEASVFSFFGVLSDVVHVAILIRFLDQSDVGVFFLSYAFLYLFAQIPRGIGIAVRKRSSEINSRRSKYLYIGFIIITPCLLIVYLVFATFLPFLNTYSSVEISAGTSIALFFASTGFATLEFSRYYMAGCSDPGLAEKLRTLIAKTSMPIITLGVMLVQPTVENALYAVFFSYFTTSIVIFALTPHEIVSPNKEDILDVIQYAKWSLLTSILNDFYRRWDTVVLGVMVGATSLSYYDSSLRIAFLSTTFAIGISKTSNVKMSGMIEMGEDIKDIAGKTVVACTFLVYPLLILAVFSGEYMLNTLFGEGYTGAMPFLILMIVVQLFQTYRVQFESVFNSSDKPKITTRASLISVIFNVLTAPILVFYFGGLGVIYSTMLSEIIRMLIYQYQVRYLIGEFILPRGAMLQVACFVLCCVLISTIDLVADVSGLSMLLSCVFIGFPIFYLTQYFVSSETRTIVSEYLEQR